MEEKKKIKLSLSAIVIFILIAIIIGMGFYIYKLNKDKYYMTIGASQQIEELNEKIDKLQEKNESFEETEEVKNLNDKIKELEDENESWQKYLNYYIGQYDNKKTSEYIIDQKIVEESGISYEDVSVTLYKDNICEIYEGLEIA